MERSLRVTERGRGRAARPALALALVLASACAPAGEAAATGIGAAEPGGSAGSSGAAPRAAAQLERLAAERAELERALEERTAELAAARAAGRQAEARALSLSGELERKEEQRIAREREWLTFTRALSKLDLEALDRLPAEVRFEPDAELAAALPGPEAESPVEPGGGPGGASEDAAWAEPEPGAAEAAAARAARSEAAGRALKNLFRIDGLRGMDLFEPGQLGEGFIGPVVFRLVDADGRLSGSLVAERLWLEASRSARTVTLVLEDGHETWRGARTDFEHPDPDPRSPGVRRVVLPSVDPDPWLEALPELFAETELDLAPDDGLWSPALVRGELNQLLRRDAAGGYFRLKRLDGVRDEVLRGVHLEGYDQQGRLERHLFADRLRVVPQERGVLLQLEDGAQVRGEDKAAFLDGRFRIFLPRADLEEWAARGIPGVAPAPGTEPAGG